MTTVTYAPSQAAGFGTFGPEQLGLPTQPQASAPYPFAGGQFAPATPFGGIAPLPTISQLHAGLQSNGGAPQPYPYQQGFSFPQPAGNSQGWNPQAGTISPAAMLGVVVWLQQHIAQQLAALVAQSGSWTAPTPPAFQPQQVMSVPGMPFGGGAGQFGRPGWGSY